MLKPKVKVQHIGADHMKRIEAAVKKAHGSYVEVGWPEDKRYPDRDVSPAQVALWNEFGTKHKRKNWYTKRAQRTPARPFMRPAIDENKTLLSNARVDAITKVAFQGASIEQSLHELGTVAKDLIVKKIDSNVRPENTPRTLAKKHWKNQGDKTLVATGLMRDSLQVVVTLSKPLKDEKEAAIKASAERAAGSAERAKKRKEHREAATASKKAARAGKLKQKTAQKAVKKATKNAAKKVAKAGKKIVRLAAKKQTATVNKLKKAVVQVPKPLKGALNLGAKSASKSGKKSASRITSARTRKLKG